jgi:hypothetical protein
MPRWRSPPTKWAIVLEVTTREETCWHAPEEGDAAARPMSSGTALDAARAGSPRPMGQGAYSLTLTTS